MIEIEMADGSKSQHRARALVVNVDKSGVPQRVEVKNGGDEKEWPAAEVVNVNSDESPFRLEVQREETQALDLRSEVTQLHLDHIRGGITALHQGKVIYEHEWQIGAQ